MICRYETTERCIFSVTWVLQQCKSDVIDVKYIEIPPPPPCTRIHIQNQHHSPSPSLSNSNKLRQIVLKLKYTTLHIYY